MPKNKEKRRPPKLATDKPAPVGSRQAKVNSSYRGKKLQSWSQEDIEWCLKDQDQNVLTLPL